MATAEKGLSLLRTPCLVASPLPLPSRSTAPRPLFSQPTSPARQLRLHCLVDRKHAATEMAPDSAQKETLDEWDNEETVLYSISPLPLLFVAALPGGDIYCIQNPCPCLSNLSDRQNFFRLILSSISQFSA